MTTASEAPAAMLKAPLVFVRHGETDWNVAGRLQGQQDIPLNPRGRDQAAAVGRMLARRLGADKLAAMRFVASPMGRTRQTMEIMREAMGLPIRDYALDERLKEITFGDWEGFTWREIQHRAADGAARREADKWRFTPPGGESYATLCRRIEPWLEAVESETVVVSHGGVARAMMHLAAGFDPVRASVAEVTQGRAMLFETGGMRWL